MESTQFHTILIIISIIFQFYQNIFIVGQFIGQIVPENYKLSLNFRGNDDCSLFTQSVKKCMYNGEVTITMIVSGRFNSFVIQSDPETKIDSAKTQLYRVYRNNTRVATKILNYIYTSGDTSSIIEIHIEQIFHMISETQFDLTLYFIREFDIYDGSESRNTNNSQINTILMMTHFVPNSAHRLFPCLSNQHEWQSSFELKLIYPLSYNVVTGISLKEKKQISADTEISIYKKTRKIPIEHLFFTIWNYRIREAGPLNFWFPPNIDSKYFSMMAGITIECFKWISNITGTIAPVRPMMHIAPISGSQLIDYFTAPGVTLLKQERVLYDDVESSTIEKLELITSISRAVASQWISILLYPKSHYDIWIYRALSHYFADFVINAIEPSFRSSDYSLARTILWTRCDRDLDASTTIPFYLFDTWDDKMYFRREDYLGYQAMAIIAMIHEIYNFEDIGSLVTQVRLRWSHRRFGPSREEMIKSLKKENVDEVINDWSKIPGVPIIHVALDRTEQHAELIQERFNPSGPWSDDKFAWTIPIRCTNSTTHEHYFQWMKPNTTFLIKADDIKACLLYTKTVVPYRVNYPEIWWMEIIAILKNNPSHLDEILKMRIIDDMLEFCLAGYIKITVLFDLLSYLPNELDYFPWLAASKAFIKLRGILSTGKTNEFKLYYKQLIQDLVFNVYDKLEKNSNQQPDNYLRLHRKNIIHIACGFGHEKCLRNAEYQLKCYIREVSSVHCQDGYCPDRWRKCLQNGHELGTIFCEGLRRANVEVWITALKLLNITNLFPSTRLAISRGLACTENINILENYIYYVLHNAEMFPNENIFPILLTAARLSEMNAQVILHFIIKNHGKLVDRLELPHNFHKHVYAISEDMYYSKANNQGINLQGSPLTYSELPDGVQKILEANTIRANKLRPMIEEYLANHYKRNST